MNVLLLDDHPLLRSALQSVVQALEPGAVVHAAATLAQAEDLLDRGQAMDLALLDLHLPDADGLTVLQAWRQAYPSMPVVVISASQDPADANRSLALGARGYIPKTTGQEVLLQALRIVLAGGEYIPSLALLRPHGAVLHPQPVGAALAVRERSPRALHPDDAPAWLSPRPPRFVEAKSTPPSRSQPDAAVDALRLTPRQMQVLDLLMQGKPNKLIARQLSLSVETVKDHVASVLRTLGVSSRTQAVLMVSQMMVSGHAPAGLAAPGGLLGWPATTAHGAGD